MARMHIRSGACLHGLLDGCGVSIAARFIGNHLPVIERAGAPRFENVAPPSQPRFPFQRA